MLEVEVKYRVADFGPLRTRLAALGAEAEPPRAESDHYFDAPDRDLRATDEALRLRVVGDANVLTYKGPRLPGPAKSRREVELPLAPGGDAADTAVEWLTALGYRPVAVVAKRRELFRLTRDGFEAEVCLDDVEGVGRFAEVEVRAEESGRAAAEAAVLGLAAELGLTDVEPRSYLGLLLAGGSDA